jgi:hypothetical protein
MDALEFSQMVTALAYPDIDEAARSEAGLLAPRKTISFENARPAICDSAVQPINRALAFGLLAQGLSANSDVGVLDYYKHLESEPGSTFSRGSDVMRRMIQAARNAMRIVDTEKLDPGGRIVRIVEDGLDNSRATPSSGLGCQLLLRGETLDLSTYMDIQGNLSDFPYDFFYWSNLHHFWAATLGASAGRLTYSTPMYYNGQGRSNGYAYAPENLRITTLPDIPSSEARNVRDELRVVESAIRSGAEKKDRKGLEGVLLSNPYARYNSVAVTYLSDFAFRLMDSVEQ